jgi:nicotinate (nicotinamide) nucleotide adenylyltransferase
LALEFFHRGGPDPARVALFPGAWNPPTRAHLDIAHAAREFADEVVWVLPRAFPHKGFEGANFHNRRRMLKALVESAGKKGFSAAVSEGGLYAEIADEARAFFGPHVEITLLCGRDAAERMATWNYATPGTFEEMLLRYRLLVAARHGEYEPARHHSSRILKLPMQATWDDVSSSEVRRRIASGEDWKKFVPPDLAGMIAQLYPEKTP